MKVLFVCRANVGRSQMASEFYNKLRPGSSASAGAIVDFPGQALKDRDTAQKVLVAMDELGVDMSSNTRKQITPEMIEEYDKVVVLCEPESIPDYLKQSPKTEIWDVEDAMNKDMEKTRLIRDEIKRRVNDLIVDHDDSLKDLKK